MARCQVHDNRGVDVRVFTKIDLERWEFTRSVEDRQSKVCSAPFMVAPFMVVLLMIVLFMIGPFS